MDAVCSGTETLECTGEASNLPAVVNIRFMNILQSTGYDGCCLSIT